MLLLSLTPLPRPLFKLNPFLSCSYSYDQRLGVSGESWADPQVFQGRAHYLAHLNPPAMLIMHAEVDDAHIYRCRVDYHNSNSRVAWVKLEIIGKWIK